jgi:hypothetical protein
VTHARGGERLAMEARDDLGVLCELRMQRLDRDTSLDDDVLALVHGAHAAFAEHAHDAIAILEHHADAWVLALHRLHHRFTHASSFEASRAAPITVGVRPEGVNVARGAAR